MGQRSPAMSLSRIAINENSAAVSELIRYLKDITGNPLGDVLGSSADYNDRADEARKYASEDYQRLLQEKTDHGRSWWITV